MTKSFDFNALTQQTLETKLGGPDNIIIHVTAPPERLVEQLASALDEIQELSKAQGHEVEAVRASYDLAAKLISCNSEGLQITADDLREKFDIYPAALAAYLAAYMDFINDFHNAKN